MSHFLLQMVTLSTQDVFLWGIILFLISFFERSIVSYIVRVSMFCERDRRRGWCKWAGQQDHILSSILIINLSLYRQCFDFGWFLATWIHPTPYILNLFPILIKENGQLLIHHLGKAHSFIRCRFLLSVPTFQCPTILHIAPCMALHHRNNQLH
jgi:hypothetical protein